MSGFRIYAVSKLTCAHARGSEEQLREVEQEIARLGQDEVSGEEVEAYMQRHHGRVLGCFLKIDVGYHRFHLHLLANLARPCLYFTVRHASSGRHAAWPSGSCYI